MFEATSGTVAGERMFASEDLEQHQADREQVRATVDLAARELLR